MSSKMRSARCATSTTIIRVSGFPSSPSGVNAEGLIVPMSASDGWLLHRMSAIGGKEDVTRAPRDVGCAAQRPFC